MRRLAVAVVLASCIAGGDQPDPVAGTAKQVITALDKDQWREDLRYFARELPKRHKNLFHTVSREQFERAVAELDATIPSLQGHQVIVGMQRIAATVGDGHTSVHLPEAFKLYPILLYQFGPELRVTAATKEYDSCLGTRVVKVGDLDIDEVQKRVRSCLPSGENEWCMMNAGPAFLVHPEVLHTLGVVPDLGRARFTFEKDDGQQITLEIEPVEAPPSVKGIRSLGLVRAAPGVPLYLQKPAEQFWFTYLPDSQTTYVSFRGYDSFGANAKKMFEFVNGHPTSRLVIDMRQNGGGDFTKVRRDLLPGLKKRPAIDRKGHLFVVVGRRTFSAAMVNAIDFRNDTNAILVGEPIGARPNSYSENDEITLPNSRLVVSYSTRYYQFVEEDVPAVMPDKRIDPNWPDFKAGRDPVMDWILSSGSADSEK